MCIFVPSSAENNEYVFVFLSNKKKNCLISCPSSSLLVQKIKE